MNQDWGNYEDQEDKSRDTGSSGKSGEIGFRFKTEIYRDDQLSPVELRRLLELHKEAHKGFVTKQKILRKERLALKEGRKDLTSQHQAQQGMGMGAASRSPYKKHPISNKAQFSGIDKQVTALPNENEADTNNELRNKLENRYTPKYQPAPQFNPKPRPY